MDVEPEDPTEEIKRLRRCISDLVSVTALPAIWSGGARSQIVRTLLDALLGMLHLDLVYVRLKDPGGDAPIEMMRIGQSADRAIRPEQFGGMLNAWLGDDPENGRR